MKNLSMSLVFLCGAMFISPNESSAQWVPTNGPYGGYVTALTIVENVGGAGTIVFAGTENGGVFRSTDFGGKWAAFENDQDNLSREVYNIADFAVVDNMLIAATSGGVFRAIINGGEWTPANCGLEPLIESSLAIWGETIFVGNYNGVYSMSINGSGWSQVEGVPVPLGVTALAVKGNYLFAGTENGDVFTKDLGNGVWIRQSHVEEHVHVIKVIGNRVFAGGSQLRYTDDDGASWQTANGIGDVSDLAGTNDNLYVSTFSAGVYRSTTYGETWEPVNNGLTNLNAQALVVKDSFILGATWGHGIFFSSNHGQEWSERNNGLRGKGIQALLKNGSDLLAGTNYMGIFRSTNSGGDWSRVTQQLEPLFVNALFRSGSYLFAGVGSGVLRSGGGISWEAAGISAHPVTAFTERVVAGGISVLFAGTAGSGIYYSENTAAEEAGTISWTWPANDGLNDPNSPTGYAQIRSLAIKGNKLFAGTIRGLFISTNDGGKWDPNNYITGDVYDFASINEYFFAASSNGVYRSNEDGDIWELVWSGPDDVPIHSVYALKTVGTNLFAGTMDGVYLTTDFGRNWFPANRGLTKRMIEHLEVLGSDLFAGPYASSVWRRPLSEMGLPRIACDPSCWKYGTVRVGDCLDKAFEVSNKGASALEVTATSIVGTNASEFSIQNGGGSFTLAPDAPPHDVVVRFCPNNMGFKSASLIITSNDPDNNPLMVCLSGVGQSTSCDTCHRVWISNHYGAVWSYNDWYKKQPCPIFILNCEYKYINWPHFGPWPSWSFVVEIDYGDFIWKEPREHFPWWNVTGALRYYYPADRFHPFITVGPGLYVLDKGVARFGGRIGLGVHYPITDDMNIEAGTDYHNVFKGSNDNLNQNKSTSFQDFNIGVTYRLR